MSREVSKPLRQQIAERAYSVCEYCLIHEEDTLWGFEVDHIVSRKHGGQTVLENLAWARACCNERKGSDIATLIGEPPRLVRLFHPRSDRWASCFHLSSFVIEAMNEIGAATVKLLQLNEDNRLLERRLLADWGRYPAVQALARMKD